MSIIPTLVDHCQYCVEIWQQNKLIPECYYVSVVPTSTAQYCFDIWQQNIGNSNYNVGEFYSYYSTSKKNSIDVFAIKYSPFNNIEADSLIFGLVLFYPWCWFCNSTCNGVFMNFIRSFAVFSIFLMFKCFNIPEVKVDEEVEEEVAVELEPEFEVEKEVKITVEVEVTV